MSDQVENHNGAQTEFPIVIKLDYPVQFGNETISSLTVKKRPKAKDFRGLSDNLPFYDRALRIIGRLTGQPANVTDELDPRDIEKISEAIAPFVPGGRQTGDDA